MAPKLYYFAIPGRGEVARLLFHIGNVQFEDVRIDGPTWPEQKSKFPFGQVPVLELDDGRMLAQSGAIGRYVAKLAGLYPEDPIQAAFADQAVFLVQDVWDATLMPSFSLPAEERAKARQDALAGKGGDKLKQMEKLLEPVEKSGGWVAGGDKMSFADLEIYVSLSNLVCGMFDGIPKNLLDSYPVLKAYRNRVAQVPAIKAFYDKDGEGVRAAFRPDA
ncbi:hypothetical protein CHLRE_16g688550v5 [Chlamydomonas reinhardtii]|uniref:Uncharacterized protein n=1 Tax=Chlamydomonas reinhardtii TaxID=3055 RepID=A8JBA7_CHLRE|nr:uncharacterized protein CHLRE_16g688550v5 [Chlamydomonas reinhardtii]PNW71797.1 hypothetical protein CHLRE_16g688550v5 [Chlamydomonas reinhardtii]|eukprot:XP_001699262.1 glutathione-S-transferase [Chlamydomonas reinhardtii]